MARRFSARQKIDLFIAGDGKCAKCGTQLEPGWHADHVYPYSKGGPTTLENAQPLCSECNLKKGVRTKMGNLNPWLREMRAWQEDAFLTYRDKDNPKDFLIVATPGSGKTLLALKIAHSLLTADKVDRVVIVVPTDNLRRQWANKANVIAGIQIDPTWGNSEFAETTDYHGVAVTYQSVASNPILYIRQCRRKRTLAIFDEIHHSGEHMSWGDGIRIAFKLAEKRLGISGTLFRTDNNSIPYVQYDDDGCSVPDFNYSYGEALRDDICRSVIFPSEEGRIEWWSANNHMSSTFTEDLPPEERARRLRTALNPDYEWLRTLIQRADSKIDEIRSDGEHPDAAGLVIAKDQEHAHEIEKILHSITGERPTLTISDVPESTDRIMAFKRGKSKWIVAVKMVSEGVDIPRLRVGVYATNVTTELFFRQAVGRFVRVLDGIDQQYAYFYIPADKILVDLALQIKIERDHHIQEQIERAKRNDYGTARQLGLYAGISAEAQVGDLIYDQDKYSPDELERAKQAKAEMGSRLEAGEIAAILRYAEKQGLLSSPRTPAKRSTVSRPTYDKRNAIRKRYSDLVNHYAHITGTEHRKVHTAIAKRTDGYHKDSALKCTVADYEKRVSLILKWIEEFKRDGTRNAY